MSERRVQIHTAHELPKTRRCELLGVARSSAYYRPKLIANEDLALMRLIDEIHLRLPFYGSRRIRDELEEHGHTVNRKRIRRLVHQMGLRALYPRQRTSQPGKGHKIYPYLLRDLPVERANQAWGEPPAKLAEEVAAVELLEEGSHEFWKRSIRSIASSREISRSLAMSTAIWTAACVVRLPLRVWSIQSRPSWMVNSRSCMSEK